MALGNIGKYELLEKLSAGGMGQLYRARTIGPGGFERIVALKVIRKDALGDPSFVAMFVAEAKVASLLSHQNLVHLYDFGNDGEEHFLAMEMVEGADLAKVTKRAREERVAFPIPVAIFIGREVAHGLDFLHRLTHKGESLRLIHRDVSPQNIMVSYDGGVKLTDFGIVRMSSRGRVTRLGVVKGKAGYLSPEQVMDRPIDARSDLFSLGIVLWETLTGGRLFPGGSDLEVMSQTLQRPIRPPSALNSEIPAALDAVVLRALAREREARFSSAREMARALDALPELGTELDTARLMRERFPESASERVLGLSSSVALIPAEASEVRKFLGFPPELAGSASPVPGTRADRTGVEARTPVVSAQVTTAPLSADDVATAPRPRRRQRARWVVSGALTVVALGIVLSLAGWRGSFRAAPTAPAVEGPAAQPEVSPAAGATPITAAEEAPVAPLPARSPAVVAEPNPPEGLERAKAVVARKRPTAAFGQIVATAVQPWAEVIVDGRARHWFTAGRWKVPAGHHQLVLSNPQAGIERRFELDLAPGETILFTGELKSLQPRSEE